MTDTAGKTRARSGQAAVEDARHQLFKAVFTLINDAIKYRYFIESICLIESLLAGWKERRG